MPELWKSEGAEQGKIVLLHGMGGVGRVWRPVAAALEDTYSLLAPDQRGHGENQKNNLDFSPLVMAQDILNLMSEKKFFPAWIIGHSMGVRTACALAHLSPMWIRGMVLVDLGITKNPGSAIVDPLVEFVKKLPDSYSDRKEMRAIIEPAAPDPSYTPFLIAVSERDEKTGRLRLPFDSRALIAIHQQSKGAPFELWLHEVGEAGIPTLILRGETSRVWTKDAYEKERRAFCEFKNFVFEEFPGAGHGLPFEKRQAFTDRVKKFIGDNS